MINAIVASTFSFAQPAGAAAPSQPAGATTTEGVAQTGADGGGTPPGPCGNMGGTSQIIMMVAMFAVFYFLLIRPQQKKAKEHQGMLDSLSKGKEIVTNGGLIGRITGVSDKTFTLEISEKVRVRVLRSQVAGVYSADNVEKK